MNQRGLTLLEIVITVAIIAFVAVLALPKLGGRKAEVKSVVRKLAIISRDIKYRAKLENATYRLVIQLVPEKSSSSLGDDDEDLKNSFWVEKAPGSVLLNSEDEESALEALKEAAESDEAKAPPSPDAFQADSRVLKEPEVLPDGMVFERVEIINRDEPITEGLAYIYYLPEGFVNEAAIHLQFGEKLKWTVAIHPLTGKADIFDEDVELSTLSQE